MLLALGLVLRVTLTFLLDPRTLPRGDEGMYLIQAAELWKTGDLDTGPFVRPPLYFLLLAGFHPVAAALGVEVTLVAKLAQCAAGTAAAIPVYRTARRIGGASVARIAAGFLLFDPTVVAYTHLVWPETFLLLLVAIVCDAVADLERRPPWQVAGVGALIGLALLLKPAFGLFTLLLAGWWWWRLGFGTALRLALLCGGVAALVIAPWVVRNQLRYGPSILLENQGAYNWWIGNDPRPAERVLMRWRALPDAVTRSRVGWERGNRNVAADPGRFVRQSGVRALNLWGFEFFVVRHVIIGGYRRADRGVLLGTFWTLQIAWGLVWLCTAAGLLRAWRDPTLRLLIVHAAIFTAVVSLMVTTTRFRVPFAFLLSVTAALGVDAILARRLRRGDLVAMGCALAVLGFSATRPVFRAIAGGDYQRPADLADREWKYFRY